MIVHALAVVVETAAGTALGILVVVAAAIAAKRQAFKR